MYRNVIVIAFTVLLFCSSIAFGKDNSLLIINKKNSDWKAVRNVIEQYGGKLDHVLLPDTFIGQIPDDIPAALTESEMVLNSEDIIFVNSVAKAKELIASDKSGGRTPFTLSPHAKAGLNFLLPRKVSSLEGHQGYRLNADGGFDILPLNSWEEPALLPEEDGNSRAVGNTYYNTSDFQAGDVAIGIIRPESNGSVDPLVETWTAAEVTASLNELLAATTKILNGNPEGNLTFVYKTENYGSGVTGTVESDYEAVSRSNFDDSLIQNVLGNLGYTGANTWAYMHEWVNDLRTTYGTDWAIGFFICDDSASGGTGRSSAYLNGPTVWEWSHTQNSVYHHEMGHSWGANDEYHPDAAQSPTGMWGYTQEVNANSQYNDGTGYFGGAGEGISALQIDNNEYVSPWGRGAWGIWDLDGDGIIEPLDTFPSVTLNAPTGSPVLSFTGTADVTPLKKETGAYADTDISINTISNVEWRINQGPWQDAVPSDGAFDESSESFSFATNSLANGGFVVEARATNNVGNISRIYARQDCTVSSSSTVDEAPMVALEVTPESGSVATTFQFDATGSWDREDGVNLEYRWDYNNDSVWDTPFSPTATTSMGFVAGAHTIVVEARDSMLNSSTRTVDVTVAASDIPPTATFVADRGMQFASTPIMFNFDASGVTDGEDAAWTLQVRWDFEDDGIWDTSYSTVKTASNDYSLDYAVNPSQENSSTYLYSGNSVTYYGQGFVAQTNGIGKVDIFIKNNGDVTPGGTLTVGIKSALAGSWLTSTTMNQADIVDARWNTFDFADISVTNGNTYYIVLYCSDGDIMWLADNSNPYPGGSHWYSFDGTSWTQNSTYDHCFRVYDSVKSTVPLTKSKVWKVRMEVIDSAGQTSQAVRHVVANGYDTPPTFNNILSTPASGDTTTSFFLSASASDVDSSTTWDGIVEYRWDADNDGNFENEFSTTTSTTVTYPKSGIYNATCEVRDRYHATTNSFAIINVAPTLNSIVLADITDGSTTDTDEPTFEVRLSTAGYPDEVIISEDPAFAGAVWQAYRPIVNYTTSSPAGLITVYAKTRSGVGNESSSQSATINFNPPLSAPGEVDDSAFMVEKGSGADLNLTWSDACNIGTVPGQDYAVYFGMIVSPWDWSSMSPIDCGVVGTSYTAGDPGPNVFFLIVPQYGGEEGSYGNGRAPAGAACAPPSLNPELCP